MQKIEYGGRVLELPEQDTFTMAEWRYIKNATGGMSAVTFPKALSEMDADAWFAYVVLAVCRAEGRPRHIVEDEVSQSNLYSVLSSYVPEDGDNESPPDPGSQEADVDAPAALSPVTTHAAHGQSSGGSYSG